MTHLREGAVGMEQHLSVAVHSAVELVVSIDGLYGMSVRGGMNVVYD